jgi:RNA polymerase sigma factor (sigma-70 family)
MLPHLDMHLDDLMQEGRIGLWQAMQRFDESHGVTLLTYAGKWVDNLMRNYVERRTQLVRFGRGKSVTILFLDAPLDGHNSTAESRNEVDVLTLYGALPVSDAREEWSLADDHVTLMRGFEKALTERERAVMWGVFVEGRTQRSLAPEWGVTHTMIQQVVAKAVKKLRAWMRREAAGATRPSDKEMGRL